MKFIKLTDINNDNMFYVDAELITCVYPHSKTHSRVHFRSCALPTMFVKEKPDTIMSRIDAT